MIAVIHLLVHQLTHWFKKFFKLSFLHLCLDLFLFSFLPLSILVVPIKEQVDFAALIGTFQEA
jgi:hypothetical protein